MHSRAKGILEKFQALFSLRSEESRPRWFWVRRSLYGLLVCSLFPFTYLVLLSDETTFLRQGTFCDSTNRITTPVHLRDRLSLDSTVPFATDLSHIVFGISSSAETWDRERPYNELWWRPGEMHGYVWLDEEPPADSTWPSTSPPYRVSTFNASTIGGSSSAAQIARTVVESYKAVMAEPGSREIRWFVIGDDGTVLFPENVVAMLNKYDHEEMYYIGSISESVEQTVRHSYSIAYGGAGFVVSQSVAAELALMMDGCLERYANLYGSDERVQSCISELGVILTIEPGFHQVDLQDDIYGLLAAHPVAPLLSLNHLRHLKPISPHWETQVEAVKSLVEVSQHDPSRTLQQAICYEHRPGVNWSVSVSWGYSVEVYPQHVSSKELAKPLMTFRTWRTRSPGPFTFDVRPVDPNRACELPLIFFLDQAKSETGRNGIIRTITEYSRNMTDSVISSCKLQSYIKALELETVTVYATKMNPDDWKRVTSL
ncbi:hypothetical protein LUZ63_004587 [Rhynchospora breviuscula]|uniref:Uncharacterized protein n=1 Tax=Rhynchospora breviuscula TaxID=2022672 RepID=A0A9Q0HSA0_9POAL|nr:hypothetical protein LUZ63_004587 [Rhynchospora breviuscula]